MEQQQRSRYTSGGGFTQEEREELSQARSICFSRILQLSRLLHSPSPLQGAVGKREEKTVEFLHL